MIERAGAFAVAFTIVACGGPGRPPPSTPPPSQPIVAEPEAADAGAAPLIDTTKLVVVDGGSASILGHGEPVHLTAATVSWPKDRRPAQFHLIGGGNGFSHALAVSADGSTPIGVAGPTPFATRPVRWRDAKLNPLPTDKRQSPVNATSRNGDVVVGTVASDLDVDPLPVVWRKDAEPAVLPLPDGMTSGRALAVSRDGSHIAGCGGDGCWTLVRWTKDKPTTHEAPATFSLGAHAMSEDGAVLVGTVLQSKPEGLRLGPGTAEQRLPPMSSVHGVSDDGKIVVGSLDGKATIWRGTKATELGLLPGHTMCWANAVSADGGRIVGTCNGQLSGAQGRTTAFVWDKKHGMRSVADALAKAGVKVPDGVSIDDASDICGYGLTLVGFVTHPSTGDPRFEAWMAILPR